MVAAESDNNASAADAWTMPCLVTRSTAVRVPMLVSTGSRMRCQRQHREQSEISD